VLQSKTNRMGVAFNQRFLIAIEVIQVP